MTSVPPYLRYLFLFALTIYSTTVFSSPIDSNDFIDQRRTRNCSCSTFSKSISKELHQIVDKAFIDKKLVGIIVGIWVPGQGNFVKIKGLGNILQDTPIMYKDQLRIGSISKSFTTTIILQLVDEGLLNLDESIERFHTGIPNANQITIRQLCNHTSGLYNYTDDPAFQQSIINDPLREWSPHELVQIAIDHEPIAPPGTQVKYNNTGFIVQGIIIEQVTGLPIDRVMRKRVTWPLHLKTTSLPITAGFKKKFAHGYIVDDEEFIDFSFLSPSFSWTAGGMISNLKDLKKWAKALATGKLISCQMQKERLTFVYPPSAPGPFQGPFVKYGLGIESLGPFLGHEGDIISYNCSINYSPCHQATFVVLTNRDSPKSFPSDNATEIFMELAKTLFPNEVPWK